MLVWEVDGSSESTHVDIAPWPWNWAQVAEETDGTWSACLWDLNDYSTLGFGNYRTNLQAKVVVEGALAKLRTAGRWSLFGPDDFGVITTVQFGIRIKRGTIDDLMVPPTS